MASRQPSLLVVSVIVALAQGCGDVVIEPLAPPPAGLVARLRDSAVAGVMFPAITAERRVTSVTLGALADRGYLTESIRAEPPPLPAAGPSFVLRTAPWRGSIWVVRTGRVAERLR